MTPVLPKAFGPTLCALLAILPMAVFAAGGASETPPTPTQTTTTCATGLIWDAKTKACVAPQQGHLDDDTRFEAVRELAYAGRIPEAQAVLAAMSDQTADRVLTYWGFTHGKAGAVERALGFYQQALAQNPDNILARSYMGQALIAAGAPAEAEAQLTEIVARGGGNTWAATSLRRALSSGQGYSY